MIFNLVLLAVIIDNSKIVQGLEGSLTLKLAHVQFGSKKFDEIIRRERSGSDSMAWLPSFGPSPFRLGRFGFPRGDEPDPAEYRHIDLLFWPTKLGTAVQRIEAFRPSDDEDHFDESETYRSGDRLIRCGAVREVGNRVWPAARIYRLKNGRWKVVSVRDSGYPVGEAKFVRKNGQVDPNRILSSTWRNSRHFTNPMGGPHLEFKQTWYLSNDRIREGTARLVPTAYSELDRLKGFVEAGNRRAFYAAVPKGIRSYLWPLMKDQRNFWWSEKKDTATQNFFIPDDFRDEAKAPIITLEKHSGHWRVTRVESP